MSKKVLVDYDQFYENWCNLTGEQQTFFLNVESALNQASPGNLLAEVKIDGIKGATEAMLAVLDGIGRRTAAELKENPRTVLILGPEEPVVHCSCFGLGDPGEEKK